MIYQGDCLEIMRKMEDGIIDLIYLDPPYNSGKDYGDFDDRWPSMDYYIEYLRYRLVECRRIMKDTASIYLHCDPTSSHYIKVMMDDVFGRSNFVNEIVWSYRKWGSKFAKFQATHDILLLYSKTKTMTFNVLYEPLSATTLKARGTKKQKKFINPVTGKLNTKSLDEDSPGSPMRNVWEIKALLGPNSERTGYPTQKPIKLLERIISASSNEGDLLLDPFCGSGTSLTVAQKLGRRYIGIDQSAEAVRISEERLRG